MEKFKTDHRRLNDNEDRLFSDMATMLKAYPQFKVKSESGKIYSILSRFGKSRKKEPFFLQKEILRNFKRYVNYRGVKWYDSMVRSAEAILKRNGA